MQGSEQSKSMQGSEQKLTPAEQASRLRSAEYDQKRQAQVKELGMSAIAFRAQILLKRRMRRMADAVAKAQVEVDCEDLTSRVRASQREFEGKRQQLDKVQKRYQQTHEHYMVRMCYLQRPQNIHGTSGSPYVSLCCRLHGVWRLLLKFRQRMPVHSTRLAPPQTRLTGARICLKSSSSIRARS